MAAASSGRPLLPARVVEIRVHARCGAREEIPELAARFLARFNAQYGRPKAAPARDAGTAHVEVHVVGQRPRARKRGTPAGDAYGWEQAIEALVTRGRKRQTALPGAEIHRCEAVSGRLDAAGREKPSARHSGSARARELEPRRGRADLKVSYKTLLTRIAEVRLTPPPR